MWQDSMKRETLIPVFPGMVHYELFDLTSNVIRNRWIFNKRMKDRWKVETSYIREHFCEKFMHGLSQDSAPTVLLLETYRFHSFKHWCLLFCSAFYFICDFQRADLVVNKTSDEFLVAARDNRSEMLFIRP